MLDGTNFATWSEEMEALLRSEGSLLWYGTTTAPPWKLRTTADEDHVNPPSADESSKSKAPAKATFLKKVYHITFSLQDLDEYHLNENNAIFEFRKDLNTAYGYLIANVHPTIRHTLVKNKLTMPHLVWAYLKDTYATITKVMQKQAVTTFFCHHCQSGTPIKQYIKFFDEAAYQIAENGITVEDSI